MKLIKSLPVLALLAVFAIVSLPFKALSENESPEKTRAYYDDLACSLIDLRDKSFWDVPGEARIMYRQKKIDNLNKYFDPMQFFAKFPLLKLKQGTQLVYVIHSDGLGMLKVIDKGETIYLYWPENYSKYIDFEKTAEGCIQYCLFHEEMRLLYVSGDPYWFQSWFVPSYKAFLHLYSKKITVSFLENGKVKTREKNLNEDMIPRLPGKGDDDDFWNKLKKAEQSQMLMPRVIFDGAIAHVTIPRFSPFGGIYNAEFRINTETREFIMVNPKYNDLSDKDKYFIPFHHRGAL